MAAETLYLDLLLKEVDRQILFVSPTEPALTEPVPKILHLGVQSDDQEYSQPLLEFDGFIRGYVKDDQIPDEDVHWEPSHPDLTQPYGSFWGKFLKLTRSSAQFIHPARMLEKLEKSRNVFQRSSIEDVASTDDIWADRKIRGWVTSAQPSHLYLHGLLGHSFRLQRFGTELIRHMEKFIPVFHILGGLRTHGDLLRCSVRPSFIVEQLVYQAIFHLPSRMSLPRLGAILSSLTTAEDDADWLQTFELVCSSLKTTRIAVIIEVTDIPPPAKSELASWPSAFESLSTRLKERCGPQLQILWLWPRFRSDGPNPGTLSGSMVVVRDKDSSGDVTSRITSPELPRPSHVMVSQPSDRIGAPTTFKDMRDQILERSVSSSQEPSLSSTATPTPRESTPSKTKLSKSINAVSLGTAQEGLASDAPPPTDPPVSKMSQARPPCTPVNVIKETETPKTRAHIELVIVCALTVEADAVHALFDDYWDDFEPRDMRSPGDTNAYSFGIMGRFPTVLVHMPGMGKTSASIVATNCHTSFPNIKLALVVGICGGVPFFNKGKTEIVLGDVIISEGLVAYDYGRRFPDNFLRKDAVSEVFGRPPTVLRGLLNKLKGRFGRRRLQERTLSHIQTLRSELGSEADYLGAGQDHLFQADYMHRHQDSSICGTCSDTAICNAARSSTCEELLCDQKRLVIRERLQASLRDGTEVEPVVHFGYIACGDQVMKSGEHRDGIANEEGVIAFEMEGAGVWDIFPCLVIKAVCDYADSHKHKKWQNYAAGTAAACTKAMIQEWYM